MRTKVHGQTWTAVGMTLLVTLVLGVVAAAAIFSIARGTEDVAAEASTGILSEATLSAAAATHNAAGQSQLIGEAADLGVATANNLDTAIGRFDEALAELEHRSDQLEAEIADDVLRSQIEAQTAALSASANEVIALIRAADLTGSTAVVDGALRSSYETLVTTLAEVRNGSYSEIAIARDDAGRLADAARFLVVLLLPVTILVGYRNRIRRIQKQSDLETELEKEQAVSQTKSDFISHMSHQLRTPLTGIYGSALELNDPAISTNIPLSRELTTMITEESAELARMVGDILAVAAADQDQLTIETQSIDPVVEINGVLEPLEIMGRATARHLQPALITADPRYFRQIITNLVSNAHRYGLAPVIVRGHTNEPNYALEVIDHGPGVNTGVEHRLFDRFVHHGDSPLLTGTVGLGLSVASILVTQMDGAIDYKRRDNTTVFTIHLPLAGSARP